MSKKTKRQKIAADLKRKNPNSNISNTPETSFSKTKEGLKVNIESLESISEPKKEQYQKDSLYVYPVQLVRKDLTKTLILSILAISLELALFFTLEKHITLPFIR